MSDEDISDLRDEIESLNDRVSRLEAKLESEPVLEEEVQSLSQFIDGRDFSAHNQRALGIGYYLEEVEGQDSFSKADIEEGYQRARITLPANMSDVLANCEDKDWMMRVGSDGQTQLRQLTQEGIDFLEGVTN